MNEKFSDSGSEEIKISFEHSAENYKQVLFWSFFLSQGNPQIQKQVLNFAVGKVGVFDKGIYETALKKFADTYFDGQNLELSPNLRTFHVPIEGKSITTDYDSGMLYRYDTSTPLKTLEHQLTMLSVPPTKEGMPADLRLFSNLTWLTDIEYYKKGGRPNRKDEPTDNSTIKDKWFSFGVTYLIKSAKTHVPVIDAMLVEARRASPFSEYRSVRFNQLHFSELNDFIESYNLKHVDDMTTANEISDYFAHVKIDEDRKVQE